MIRTVGAIALAAVMCVTAGLALACERPSAAGASVNPGRIDQARLSNAILAEVNYVRCQSGLRALAPAPGSLTDSAAAHSAWMARANSLSHRGGGASGRDLRDRLDRAGARVRTASENIAQLPRFAFDGQRFRVVDRRRCVFQTRDGRQIAPHSYQSLARRAVALWLGSPGHRRNVLDSDVTAMGAGAGFSQSETCGTFWITQIFVG